MPSITDFSWGWIVIFSHQYISIRSINKISINIIKVVWIYVDKNTSSESQIDFTVSYILKNRTLSNFSNVEIRSLLSSFFINLITTQIKRGENVQNRQLQTWLSKEEYEQLGYEWQEQLELRRELKDKPSDLKRYEEKLREATFNYNRAEGYSSKRKYNTAKKFYDKSESLCEDALEILQEILHYDISLCIWLDRDINSDWGSGLSAIITILQMKILCGLAKPSWRLLVPMTKSESKNCLKEVRPPVGWTFLDEIEVFYK